MNVRGSCEVGNIGRSVKNAVWEWWFCCLIECVGKCCRSWTRKMQAKKKMGVADGGSYVPI